MGHQDGQEIQIQQELIREGEQHKLHIILISHIEESENTSIIKQKKKVMVSTKKDTEETNQSINSS